MTTLKEHLIMWPVLILLGATLITLLYGIHTWLPAQTDRKSTRLNSSHSQQSRMPSSA